jgi:hypothetical protein
MTADRCPTDVVLALVRVINAELPRTTASALLDPDVEIHMDTTIHRGIETWYKWVHLIRNCGRISDLRMTEYSARTDPQEPQLVHLSARWTGILRGQNPPRTSEHSIQLRYLVRQGCIRTIWTRKSNYEFIFGSWIKYVVCYRLFLAWAILYFAAMSLRRKDLLVDRC